MCYKKYTKAYAATILLEDPSPIKLFDKDTTVLTLGKKLSSL